MNRIKSGSGFGIGSFILNIAVAIYLIANGILGFSTNWRGQHDGEFRTMINAIGITGDLANILTIVLSVCALAAGAFLLLQLFKVVTPITDLLLFVFVIVWVVFIVIIDIINPLQNQNKFELLPYLLQLSSHLMVLGALISSTKRISR
jgi:hypothetical protein